MYVTCACTCRGAPDHLEVLFLQDDLFLSGAIEINRLNNEIALSKSMTALELWCMIQIYRIYYTGFSTCCYYSAVPTHTVVWYITSKLLHFCRCCFITIHHWRRPVRFGIISVVNYDNLSLPNDMNHVGELHIFYCRACDMLNTVGPYSKSESGRRQLRIAVSDLPSLIY